jgi:hypothetical protein
VVFNRQGRVRWGFILHLGDVAGCSRAMPVAACGVVSNERLVDFKVTCGFVLSLSFCTSGCHAGVSSLAALANSRPVSFPSFLNEAFAQPRRFSPTESDDDNVALSP